MCLTTSPNRIVATVVVAGFVLAKGKRADSMSAEENKSITLRLYEEVLNTGTSIRPRRCLPPTS
jgi:hypothetical protein